MPHNNTLFIDIHKTAHCQPVTSCIQGTDSVGKSVGQHRDHSVHKVHAGSPLVRVLIERTLLLYIMAHIRDVNAEMVDRLPVYRLLRHTDCIVQILRILSVDGHHRHISKVHSSVLLDLLRYILRRERLRDMGDLLHHLFRELLRQPVGPDDGQDIHSRIIDMAQNFLYMAFRIFIFRRVSIQLYHNFMPGYRAVFLSLGDKDIHGDPRVVRDHETEILVFLEGSDQGLVGMLQYL